MMETARRMIQPTAELDKPADLFEMMVWVDGIGVPFRWFQRPNCGCFGPDFEVRDLLAPGSLSIPSPEQYATRALTSNACQPAVSRVAGLDSNAAEPWSCQRCEHSVNLKNVIRLMRPWLWCRNITLVRSRGLVQYRLAD